MSTSNALEQLSADFAKQSRIELDCPGVDIQLYALPCTFEESLQIAQIANHDDPAKAAKMTAALLVKKVELEDGGKAFLNCNNQPAAKVLQSSVRPSVISSLFSQIAMTAVSEEQREDLEKKFGELD